MKKLILAFAFVMFFVVGANFVEAGICNVDGALCSKMACIKDKLSGVVYKPTLVAAVGAPVTAIKISTGDVYSTLTHASSSNYFSGQYKLGILYQDDPVYHDGQRITIFHYEPDMPAGKYAVTAGPLGANCPSTTYNVNLPGNVSCSKVDQSVCDNPPVSSCTGGCVCCDCDDAIANFVLQTTFDCGLRIFNGSKTIVPACECGSTISPLRIAVDGNIYGIVLVNPTNTYASDITINTPSGLKAIRKLSAY